MPATIAMKNILCLTLYLFSFCLIQAQEPGYFVLPESGTYNVSSNPLPKLRQRNYGAIIGIQRGRSTAFEMGAEMHWRKIGLRKPNIWGATANVEYSFGQHLVGYKAGVWRKQGRVNLTYGANVAYFNDFNGGHQFGIGPAVGFRLFGLHLINGINILTGNINRDKTATSSAGANTLYMSLRYYFPLQNKFVWDRKDKKDGGGLFRKKEKEEEPKGLFRSRKKEPEKEKKGLFHFKKKEAEKEEEPKGLRRLFPKKD
jgi:hypothetical protein